MGVVFAALDLEKNIPVAVKLLKTTAFSSAQERARFQREAETAASLSHPNLVKVYDFGTDEKGAHYMVSEFLKGRTLEKRLSESGYLSLTESLHHLFPVIGALAYVHQQGVVHRDVKPSNIFLTDEGSSMTIPKLVDFGIAASIDRTRLTETNKTLGTLAYMAPEQILNKSIGPSIDIWAIGTVLYRCLCGVEPFQEETIEKQLHRITHDTVPSIVGRGESLDPRFCAAVERSFHQSLDKRYSSMENLAKAWLLTAANAGISVPNSPDPIGLPQWNQWLKEARQSGAETLKG